MPHARDEVALLQQRKNSHNPVEILRKAIILKSGLSKFHCLIFFMNKSFSDLGPLLLGVMHFTKIQLSDVTFIIDRLQKWLPINYSFIFVLISLTSLVGMRKIKKNFHTKMRLISAISIWIKE